MHSPKPPNKSSLSYNKPRLCEYKHALPLLPPYAGPRPWLVKTTSPHHGVFYTTTVQSSGKIRGVWEVWRIGGSLGLEPTLLIFQLGTQLLQEMQTL